MDCESAAVITRKRNALAFRVFQCMEGLTANKCSLKPGSTYYFGAARMRETDNTNYFLKKTV